MVENNIGIQMGTCTDYRVFTDNTARRDDCPVADDRARLDDNTVTMDELEKSLAELKDKIEQSGFEVNLEDYRSSLLEKY